MKKIIYLILISIILFSFYGCSCKSSKTYEIALVTDIGNIDDGSFNQYSWEGVKNYAYKNNKTYNYYRSGEDTDVSRTETIKTAIDKGAKIVVCPGYLFEEVVCKLQKEYKDIAFLLLDGEPNINKVYESASNTCSILYSEEQAGFYAGYAAIKEGYRNLGFLGGMAGPSVIRFGYGYIQGIDYAAKELNLGEKSVNVKYAYAGTFSPSSDVKTKMDGWYANKTEIVFSCGGGIYLSVTAAASDAEKKVIGVDVDQSKASATIITSAIKKLSWSVEASLDAFYKNNMKWDNTRSGKTLILGTKDDAVGLPTENDSWRFKKFTVEEYKTLYEKVKKDEIKVSSQTNSKPITSNKVVVDYNA